jgi:formylmethanofuran dehydrogenase subunit D
MKNLTFNVEDIFENIPGDDDNVIMKIPPEVLEQTGWQEGDTLTVTLEDGAIILSKNG